MKRLLHFILALSLVLQPLGAEAPVVRLKNIASIEGIRGNILVGYGIVVGLDKTGDDFTKSTYTKASLVSMLNRMGVKSVEDNIASKSVAAVIVTAQLPPFARTGSKITVNVSAIGTCKSLLGGTLIVTPLMGADNQIYAVAQGAIVTGGLGASGESGSNVSKNVPTGGSVPGGGIVEKEVAFSLAQQQKFNIGLHTPDFTTARRVADRINENFQEDIARPIDLGTIELLIPKHQREDITGFFAKLEQLTVQPDHAAKVIINEREGVIVMGDDVHISTVAVNHGNLVISVTEARKVSQPTATNTVDSKAETKEVQDTKIDVNEQKSKMIVMDKNATLKDLVKAFNALGVSVRDMITIIRTIKASGALHAELEVL